jgi:glycosyltransferase involved in cell wall biosynthesis
MERHEVALLHCRSYISALAGLEIKKRFNIPFVFDMRGFWADERIDGKIWNLSNPVYKFIYDFFKRKEKAFLQQSAHVVSLTENAKREILSWNLSGLSPGKITVIPCCADLGHFHPDRVDSALSRKLRNELNLPESCKILIYLGSLGTWYMSEEMMQFFSVLRKQDPDYLFLLVTRDSAEMLESLCRKYEIPPASIRVKSAERDEVPALIAMSTASVFFILPSYSKKASSPTKLAELMAMGIPVICNEGVGDVAEIIEKSNAGWAVSDFSAASLDTVAHKLINSEAIDRQKLRKAAEEYGSLEKGVMAYAGIYKSLLNP